MRPVRFAHPGWWFGALAVLVVSGVWLLGQSQGSRLDQVDAMDCIELERALFFEARAAAPKDLLVYIETELGLRCHAGAPIVTTPDGAPVPTTITPAPTTSASPGEP